MGRAREQVLMGMCGMKERGGGGGGCLLMPKQNHHTLLVSDVPGPGGEHGGSLGGEGSEAGDIERRVQRLAGPNQHLCKHLEVRICKTAAAPCTSDVVESCYNIYTLGRSTRGVNQDIEQQGRLMANL